MKRGRRKKRRRYRNERRDVGGITQEARRGHMGDEGCTGDITVKAFALSVSFQL